MKKKKIWSKTYIYAFLMIITFLRALGTYVFIIPNGFAPGGVNGIASITYNIVLQYNKLIADTIFNPGIIVFVLNIPLIIWSFRVLDKEFAINSMICIIVFSVLMGILTISGFPQFTATNYESGIMLLAALAGGTLLGLGLGIMLRMNASLGGTDIIGKIIFKRKPVLNVQWIIFICDSIVVAMSAILGFLNIRQADSTKDIMVKILSPVFYSFISLFVSSKAADIILVGFQSSVVFNVITTKPKEMGEAIVKRIQRGATVIRGQGMYTNEERPILICVIKRKQIVPLRDLIQEIDADAFSYVTDAREVNGLGFYTEI